MARLYFHLVAGTPVYQNRGRLAHDLSCVRRNDCRRYPLVNTRAMRHASLTSRQINAIQERERASQTRCATRLLRFIGPHTRDSMKNQIAFL